KHFGCGEPFLDVAMSAFGGTADVAVLFDAFRAATTAGGAFGFDRTFENKWRIQLSGPLRIGEEGENFVVNLHEAGCFICITLGRRSYCADRLADVSECNLIF